MKALRIVLIVVGLLTLIFSVTSLLVPWAVIVSFCHRFAVTLPAETEANASPKAQARTKGATRTCSRASSTCSTARSANTSGATPSRWRAS